MWYFIRLVALLPLPLWHRISNVLAFLLRHVVRYRYKVIYSNLQGAFPDAEPKIIKRLVKSFYLNFADLLVESVKGFSISRKALLSRVKTVGIEPLNQALQQGQRPIIIGVHNCNWEWSLLSQSLEAQGTFYSAYQEMSSPRAEQIINRMRTRFGASMIGKTKVLREVIKMRKESFVLAMVADQSPRSKENRFWTTFLNQETAFFTATEKMAVKLDMPVFYLNMRRNGRGRYVQHYTQIGFPPYDYNPDTSGFPMTARYAKMVELAVRQAPADWLWSHKRWKHKRQD